MGREPRARLTLLSYQVAKARRIGSAAAKCSKRMAESRYATLAGVLRDDEAVLYRAWVAHKTVHQRPSKCGDDCEARQVLEDALGKIRVLLGREDGARI